MEFSSDQDAPIDVQSMKNEDTPTHSLNDIQAAVLCTK
jgi:hypothetical protein